MNATTQVLGNRAELLLQTGDLHLRSRELEHQVPVLRWIVSLARDLGVDLVVLAGDLTGRACPHLARPVERQALLEELIQPLREVGAHVVVVRGNHDVPADWRWLHAVPGVTWVERPTTLLFSNGFLLHALPYPDRSWLARVVTGRDDLTTRMADAVRAIVAGFSPGGVLTGHLATSGVTLSTGQPLVGSDVEVPSTWLTGRQALLNHVHKPQVSGSVVHVGSPWATDFGEEEAKRVVVYHCTTGKVESVETPASRRLSVDAEWQPTDRSWSISTTPFVPWAGTLVRVRAHFDEGENVDLSFLEKLVDDRALGGKVERCPRRTHRQRAPEVVVARSPLARLRAFEVAECRAVDARTVALAEGISGQDEPEVWYSETSRREARQHTEVEGEATQV